VTAHYWYEVKNNIHVPTCIIFLSKKYELTTMIFNIFITFLWFRGSLWKYASQSADVTPILCLWFWYWIHEGKSNE